MTDAPSAVCRVTVHTDTARADLSLPSGVSVAELIPMIVDTVGSAHPADPETDTGTDTDTDTDTDTIPTPYRLSVAGAAALDDAQSLAAQGIRDSSLLLLTRTPVEAARIRFDDPAVRVATEVQSLTRLWTPAAMRLAAAMTAAWFAVIGIWSAPERGSTAAAAGVAAGFLTAAVVVGRVHRDRAAALTLRLCGAGFAGVAGFSAVPGGVGPPNVVLGATSLAATAGVALTVGQDITAMAAVVGFSAWVGIAALTMTVTGLGVSTVAAVFTVAAVGLLQVAGPLSAGLAGLTGRAPDSAAEDTRVVRAHRLLSGLIVAFACAAAAGAALVLAAAHYESVSRPGAAVFAAATGGALALAARSQADRLRVAVLLASGLGVIGVALADVAHSGRDPAVAATVAIVAAGVALLRTSARQSGSPPTDHVHAARVARVAECLVLAALVPLAAWLSGGYGTVRGLGWG